MQKKYCTISRDVLGPWGYKQINTCIKWIYVMHYVGNIVKHRWDLNCKQTVTSKQNWK